jgi:hypothetical protein
MGEVSQPFHTIVVGLTLSSTLPFDMANNDSYSDRPIASGDSYSPQQPGYNSYTAAGDSTFLPRISPEASLPYPKRPKPNAENETPRYETTRPSQTRSKNFFNQILTLKF